VLLPVSEYNIVPYMAAADTLLSEASSTVFDFLALDRTGVIYDMPSNRLAHSDGMPLLEVDNREFLKDAFVHVGAPEELRAGILRALSPTPEMRTAAARDRARLFHKLDGRASERLKATVEALLAEGGHENGA
jgi:CDP-glycerol glycerophosphotransferase (TagB/SpsB family)